MINEEWIRFNIYAKIWHCLLILMFITPIWFDAKIGRYYLSYRIQKARDNNLNKAYALLHKRKGRK